MPIALICAVAAIVLFALSALSVPSPRVNLQSAGLLCLSIAFTVAKVI